MVWTIVLIVVLGLLVLIVLAIFYGRSRWQMETQHIHTRLNNARCPVTPTTFDASELEGLPAPVQRYFRTVLNDGQPIIQAVTVEHGGSFNASEDKEQWQPFSSTQQVVTQRPGFDWHARIAMAPGLSLQVHDAYVEGTGILHVSLLGLLSLVDLRGTENVARGELMRFFAEMAWYPTALLPSQGVQWEAVDDTSAQATLRDGDITLTMLFRFNGDNLIESVYSPARDLTVGNITVPAPWEGRWHNYQRRDGMLVPIEGEVAWLLSAGEKPYWRGRITSIRYEFA
jgi:hypothetical protein